MPLKANKITCSRAWAGLQAASISMAIISSSQLKNVTKAAKPSEECLDVCAHRRKWPVKHNCDETLSNRDEGDWAKGIRIK
jgi:hypothetical protein